MDEVLDLPRQITRTYLASPASLEKTDTHIEDEIRRNLEGYKFSRLLTMKFQKQLDEHIQKTGSRRKEIDELTQKAIIQRITHG